MKGRITLEVNEKSWNSREKASNDEIQRLKQEVENAKIMLKLGKTQYGKEGEAEGEGRDIDKYYLRVEGQRLEEIVKQMESGSFSLNSKLDEILSTSRKVNSTCDLSTTLTDLRKIAEQGNFPSEEGRKLDLSSVVNYPNPDFITEYAFRIIIYFAEIHPESPEGKCIWSDLQRIQTENSGEQYFIVLEEFTKFTLQENAIEVYRRELKEKIK
jgi:hypothetical protein